MKLLHCLIQNNILCITLSREFNSSHWLFISRLQSICRAHLRFLFFLLLIIQLHFFYKFDLASFRHTHSIVSNSVKRIYENSLPGNVYIQAKKLYASLCAQYHCGLFSTAEFDDEY